MAEKKNLVLIHGFLETKSVWDLVTASINRTYRITIPELPGHGECKLNLERTIDDFARSIAPQIENPSIIVGHSMGGYVAIALSRLFPEKVKAICLFHSKASADDEVKRKDRLRAIDAVQRSKSAYIKTAITSLFYEARCKEHMDVIEQLSQTAEGMNTEAITCSLEAMMNRPDSVDFLKMRRFPLYYFLGKWDQIMPAEMVEKEILQLPGTISYVAEETGHMGHLESTHEAIGFIERIMRADY